MWFGGILVGWERIFWGAWVSCGGFVLNVVRNGGFFNSRVLVVF